MPKKEKLTLDDLKVQSFVTSVHNPDALQGGATGNCLSFIGVTCPDPNCDAQSVPLDECSTPDIIRTTTEITPAFTATGCLVCL